MQSMVRNTLRGRVAGLLAAVCAVTAVVGFAGAGSAAAASTTNVNYIYNPSAPIPAYLAAKANGYFQKYGVNVNEIDLADPGAATTELIGGKADISDVPLPTTMIAIHKGAPLKIIGGEAYGLQDKQNGKEYQLAELAAPKSTGITSLKGLKGKTVAVASLGSEYYFELKGALAAAGVPASSVKFVAIPYTGMVAALAEGQADAALMLAADVPLLDEHSPSQVIETGSQLLGLPLEVPSAIAVSNSFMKANSAAVTGFMTAMLKGEQWVDNDLAHDGGKKVSALVEKATQYPAPVLKGFMALNGDGSGKESLYTNPLSVPEAVVTAQTRLLHFAGELPSANALSYNQVVDNTPLQAAFGQLGLHWRSSVPMPD